MNKIILFIFLTFNILNVFIANGTTYYSTGVTDWKWSSTTSWTLNSNGTGNCGCTPTVGDIAIIRNGDSISVPSTITISGDITLQVYGVLNITGFLKLDGPGSIVNIYTGGHLSSNGSASSKLRIGGSGGAEYTGTDGTIVGPWTIKDGSSTSNGTLPIVLNFFNVMNENDHTILEWQTSQEINNSYFEIQKSNDGINFIAIDKINASDVSSNLHFYSYTDKQPFFKNYYRLKQVDIDGFFSYSKIIESDVNNEFNFTVYPNPATNNNFEIQLNSLQNNASLTLLNIQGKEIYSKIITMNDENIVVGNDIATNLTPGIYFIIVTSDTKTINKKLVIQ